jgi:hypothetical protein
VIYCSFLYNLAQYFIKQGKQGNMVLQAGWRQVGDQVSQLIARAWLDSEFQERLIADPKATLEGEGIEIPEGLQVTIDRSTIDWSIGSRAGDVVWTIPLPPRPADISEEQLSAWARGDFSQQNITCVNACC